MARSAEIVIKFHLDSTSGVSYCVQLGQHVRPALIVVILKSGDQPLAVKELVAHEALNPNTVLLACRELSPTRCIQAVAQLAPAGRT